MSWNLLSPRLCHPLRLDAGCEPIFLEWTYRREAILNQIAFTDADIVCLQVWSKDDSVQGVAICGVIRNFVKCQLFDMY